MLCTRTLSTGIVAIIVMFGFQHHAHVSMATNLHGTARAAITAASAPCETLPWHRES